jgi:hypothetical protein
MLDLLENKLVEGSTVPDAMPIYTGGKANTFIEGVIISRERVKKQ